MEFPRNCEGISGAPVMTRPRKHGIFAALLGALLLATPSVSLGQTLKEADALEKKVSKLHDDGRYAEAIPIAERIVTIREKQLGPNHLLVAASLNNLADLYNTQGRYADAKPLHHRSLAIRERALGPNHPDVAQSLNNLAQVYAHQGHYTEAEAFYKRSVAFIEKSLTSMQRATHGSSPERMPTGSN